jgi:predicted kinase
MTEENDRIWKALSDPTRRSILDSLRKGPRTTTEIVEAFPDMTRRAVMKHIDVLRNAGLVITREDGRRRVNSLNAVPIRQIYERWMSPFAEIWSSTLLRIKGDVETNKLRVIIVVGLPGVGKSTLAEGLAERLELPLFSVDPIESSILKSGIERSFETGLAAYLVAETLASEQLRSGLSVITDSVSAVEKPRELWRNLSNKHNARLIIIECVLDSALHKERVEARVRNMHGFQELTWDEVEARREIYVPWKEERLVLDTGVNPAENLEKALRYIKSSNRE